MSTSTTEPSIENLVFSSDGLGVVNFGDEAGQALAVLIEILGPTDFDTGWGDPSVETSEYLWPGCPGSVARLVSWEGVMGVGFTDWDQRSEDPRATLDTPYLAGAGLWLDSPVTTPDGARSGDTVGQLRAIYGDRLSITYTEDGPLPAVFAIDGTAKNGSLDRTGGLRGNIQDDIVTDDSMTVGWTAGVSCDTP
jgi:hypothetical protein